MCYINYVMDRKSLGYECRMHERRYTLLQITDSTFILIKNLPSKMRRKSKKVIAVVCLGVALSFSHVKPVEAIGMSIPPQQTVVMPRQNANRLIEESGININFQPPVKIRMGSITKSREIGLPLCIYMMDERFISTPEVSEMIRKLRGGRWSTALIGNTICLAVVYAIWVLVGGSSAFVQQPNPGWGLQNNVYEPPGLVRPTDCETQLYAGSPQESLKTEASRNQPNPKDRWLLVESRPKLVIRRGQAQFKTKYHGALAGLPYKIKKNGGTSTLRTEANVDTFMDVVGKIVEDRKSIWFEEGSYQGGTTREVESINIYNEEENRIAIFKRSTGEFITFCEPTDIEIDDLMETGNFLGQLGWSSGQAKNLPPQVNSQQNVANEMTPIDSFESNVMGMTPSPEFSPVDEVPNPGFTPLNSFESDVLGITPVDSSASDWQI